MRLMKYGIVLLAMPLFAQYNFDAVDRSSPAEYNTTKVHLSANAMKSIWSKRKHLLYTDTTIYSDEVSVMEVWGTSGSYQISVYYVYPIINGDSFPLVSIGIAKHIDPSVDPAAGTYYMASVLANYLMITQSKADIYQAEPQESFTVYADWSSLTWSDGHKFLKWLKISQKKWFYVID